MNKYPCTSCGQCCKNIGKILTHGTTLSEGDDFYPEIAKFPYLLDASGTCEKLQPDNTCGVYENRPDLCNIEFMYHKYYAMDITKREYFFETMAACNKMIIEACLPDRYIVKIELS